MEVDTLILKVKEQYRELDGAFTPGEAWFLFKTSAILESIGWTLLITGIVFKHFSWPLHDWILPIGGSIHGAFVVIYVLIVFFTHRVLGWSIPTMLIGEAANAIPYGALVFERWAARRRMRTEIET